MENILKKSVPILFPILIIASLNISGCYRPPKPKEPYETLQSEIKAKATKVKVEYLVDVIQKHGSDEEQKAAVKLLAEIGKPSIAALIEKIKDDKAKHRDDYLLALKLIGEPTVGEVIILLDSDKPLVREDAFAILLAIGKDAVPSLIKSLSSDNKNIRPSIISLLAIIKDERAVESLAKVFLDEKEDAKLRTQALAALVSIGKPAVPHLARALHADDGETRKAASLAIEQITRGR
ncbi:MAG: hypothetical protein AMJ78_06920 [Omnitrophica WOR_2 bacterium SM23_29]|nr:MAG: hypothetical protein AMJ78_06920 [Omnitrophica WOR_2 bacterium SM23_29]